MPEPYSTQTLEINGRTFRINRILSQNKNAIARLKGDTLTVSIPSRWSRADKEKIGGDLEKKAIRAIEKGKWHGEDDRKVEFRHGQRLSAMGKEFLVLFFPGKKFRSRLNDRIIEITVPDVQKKTERASTLVRKELIKAVTPSLRERVEFFNNCFFNEKIPRITVRDNVSRWGSLAPDNTIALSFRLLFMPREILDYVIVHELSHTKYKSHGVRFWGTVGKVIPDHKAKRKWLRENGWRYPEKNPGITQGTESGSLQLKLF
ncbi:MAG: YgjP-like metallopeptidase domain-containing protein [Candidatus Micrarchaeota archaeon]